MVVQIMKSYFCLPSFIVSSLKNEILAHNFVFPFSIFVLIRILIYPNLCSLVWKLISKLHCSIFQNHKWIYIIMCNIYLNIQHIYLYMPNILLSFLFFPIDQWKNKVIWENFKMNDAKLTCNCALYFWKQTYIMKHLATWDTFLKICKYTVTLQRFFHYFNPLVRFRSGCFQVRHSPYCHWSVHFLFLLHRSGDLRPISQAAT